MSYSRQACPVWLFTDLTGNILDDNYWMHFLENTIPYLQQNVYQTAQGPEGAVFNNPLQFGPDGTLPSNMYFEDGKTYRLELRRGPLQTDPLIRLIENFDAESGAGPAPGVNLPIENQLSNPQFSDLDFEGSYVINNASGTNDYAFAADWVLEVSSSAAVVITLTRVAITGNENLPADDPTNPSYALKIDVTSGTVTSLKLRQRFDNAPAIWASEGVSLTLLGKVETGSGDLSAHYIPSNSTAFPGGTLLMSEVLSSVYQSYFGGSLIPASDSTDTGDTGYVDIELTLPITGITYLTNLQVIGSAQNSDFPYAQTTVERQTDQLFHYYKDPLIRKPIKSALVGWDFPLNPAQVLGSTVAASALSSGNKSKYVWDQTLMFQETNSGIGVTRGSTGEIVLTAALASKTALIQYLPADQANLLLQGPMAVNVAAKCKTATTVVATVSLWYTTDATLPSAIAATDNSIVATLDDKGHPATTNGAGWVEVPRRQNTPGQFTINPHATPAAFNDYNLNGWELATVVDTATFFAIVVGTAQMPITNTVSFLSIGLMPGDIATRPAQQTTDEVLRECRYYYEKSWEVGTAVGTATPINMESNEGVVDYDVAGTQRKVHGASFNLKYRTVKRTKPTITTYSVGDGSTTDLWVGLNQDNTYPVPTSGANPRNVAASWTSVGKISTDSAFFSCSGTSTTYFTVGGLTRSDVTIQYHYTLDARLGIVN